MSTPDADQLAEKAKRKEEARKMAQAVDVRAELCQAVYKDRLL